MRTVRRGRGQGQGRPAAGRGTGSTGTTGATREDRKQAVEYTRCYRRSRDDAQRLGGVSHRSLSLALLLGVVGGCAGGPSRSACSRAGGAAHALSRLRRPRSRRQSAAVTQLQRAGRRAAVVAAQRRRHRGGHRCREAPPGVPVPVADARLFRACAELAQVVPEEGVVGYASVEFALQRNGIVEPSPHLLVVWDDVDSTADVIAQQIKPRLAELLADGTITRLGVGAVHRQAATKGITGAVVFALQSSSVTTAPIPRVLPAGSVTTRRDPRRALPRPRGVRHPRRRRLDRAAAARGRRRWPVPDHARLQDPRRPPAGRGHRHRRHRLDGARQLPGVVRRRAAADLAARPDRRHAGRRRGRRRAPPARDGQPRSRGRGARRAGVGRRGRRRRARALPGDARHQGGRAHLADDRVGRGPRARGQHQDRRRARDRRARLQHSRGARRPHEQPGSPHQHHVGVGDAHRYRRRARRRGRRAGARCS